MPKPKKKVDNVVVHDGQLTVTTTKFNQADEKVQTLQIRPFVDGARIGKVTIGLGRTINLGNYESARVDVRMEVPCYREEMLKTYEAALTIVGNKLGEQVKEIEEHLGVSSESSVEELI